MTQEEWVRVQILSRNELARASARRRARASGVDAFPSTVVIARAPLDAFSSTQSRAKTHRGTIRRLIH